MFQCHNLFSQIYNQKPYFILYMLFFSKIFWKPNKFVHIERTRVSYLCLIRTHSCDSIKCSLYFMPDTRNVSQPEDRAGPCQCSNVHFISNRKGLEQYSYSKCNLNILLTTRITNSAAWSLKMREKAHFRAHIHIMIYSVRTRKHCNPIYIVKRRVCRLQRSIWNSER